MGSETVSGLTFGSNGFYLNMADGNDLGDDESGNGNDFAEVNLDTTNKSNQLYDTHTRNFDRALADEITQAAFKSVDNRLPCD